MDVHRLFEIRGLHVFDRTELNRPGVVDEDVEAPARRNDVFDETAGSGPVGQVNRQPQEIKISSPWDGSVTQRGVFRVASCHC